MDIETLTTFFMWCTIINGGMFLVGAIFCTLAPDFVYRAKTKWFPIPRETFNVVVYSSLVLFKIAFIVFNLVPYVALRIIG